DRRLESEEQTNARRFGGRLRKSRLVRKEKRNRNAAPHFCRGGTERCAGEDHPCRFYAMLAGGDRVAGKRHYPLRDRVCNAANTIQVARQRIVEDVKVLCFRPAARESVGYRLHRCRHRVQQCDPCALSAVSRPGHCVSCFGIRGSNRKAGSAEPKWSVVRPPYTAAGRSRGSSCRNGPHPLSSFLKLDSRAPVALGDS